MGIHGRHGKTHVSDHRTYRTCWTLDAWQKALGEANEHRVMGLDFESAPDPARYLTMSALRAEDGAVIAGHGIAWKRDDDGSIHSAYCPVRHWAESAGGIQPQARGAAAMLSDAVRARKPKQLLVVANLAMELSLMLRENIVWPLEGQLQDVMIAARVLNKGVGIEELIGLKALGEEYLGRDHSAKTEMDTWLLKHRFKPGKDIWRAPVALASPYGQDDARDTIEIWAMWEEMLLQDTTRWWWHRDPDRMNRKDLYELEIDAGVKAVMTGLRGNRIDIGLCRKQTEAAEILQNVTKRWVQTAFEMPTLNPGSATQLRGLLFTEAFGLQVSLEHMTDTFVKLPEAKQTATIAGHGEKPLHDYASLDVDALKYYESQMPERADLFFVLAVYRKCQTALMWFKDNVREYGGIVPDPWWPDADNVEWLWIIYHRLRTVGTLSGRMSASDFNSQQVPKRLKMLIAAERLMRILEEFLPASQLQELADMLLFALAKEGDEAKYANVEPGARVVDFSVRSAFVARPGCNFRTHDLSQVEMKGFANISGNQLLCDGYGAPIPRHQIDVELGIIRGILDGGDPATVLRELSTHGIDIRRHERYEHENKFDIHKFVAEQIEITRKEAKGVNFGIVYGMGQRKLCRQLGWDKTKGTHYLGQYHGKFPEISITQAVIKQKLRERGYIFDAFGRRYHLPMARSYVGLNRLIQGWAASMFKVGFVRTCDVFAAPCYAGVMHPIMRRRVMEGPKVLTCVHDELDEEIPVEFDDGLLDFQVRSCMTLMGGLRSPLSTSSESSATSWDDVGPRDFDYKGL